MLKNRWCLLVHAALGLVLASSLGEAARADFVVNLTEFGGDVVATGSGTIDTAALTLRGTFAAAPELIAADGLAIFGHYNVSGSTGSFYSGISGPATFGNGGGIFPNLGTGDLVGIYAFAFHEMVLPAAICLRLPVKLEQHMDRPVLPQPRPDARDLYLDVGGWGQCRLLQDEHRHLRRARAR